MYIMISLHKLYVSHLCHDATDTLSNECHLCHIFVTLIRALGHPVMGSTVPLSVIGFPALTLGNFSIFQSILASTFLKHKVLFQYFGTI